MRDRWQDAGVGVRGDREGTVAELLGEDLERHPRLQGQACRCVPEIMEPERRQPGGPVEPLERARRRVWVQLGRPRV